jgi:hypothetical protein
MLSDHIYLFQVLFFPHCTWWVSHIMQKKDKNEKCFEKKNVDQNRLFIFWNAPK